MKIDLKESLNELDIISDNKYDLYNIYLSKNPSIGTKKKLAEAIYKNKTPKEISLILKEDWDDAAWHDTADQEQVDQPDYFPDGDEESEWTEMDSKSVRDSDGFLTDYTWYWRNNNGEDQHVFVFGDSDLYGPEDGYFDWECDSLEEAQEWFDSYVGPGDDEDDWIDESLKEEIDNDEKEKLDFILSKYFYSLASYKLSKDGKYYLFFYKDYDDGKNHLAQRVPKNIFKKSLKDIDLYINNSNESSDFIDRKYEKELNESLKEERFIDSGYRDGDVVFVGDANGYHGSFLIEGDVKNIPKELYKHIRKITKYGNLDEPYYEVEYKLDSNNLFEEDYRKFFEYIIPVLKNAGITIIYEDDLMNESLNKDFTEDDLVKGKKFVNKNGVEITIVEPTKDGKVQFIVKGKSFSPDCGGGSKKGIFNMLKKNGYSLKEDVSKEWKPNLNFKHIKDVLEKALSRGKYINNEREEVKAALDLCDKKQKYTPEQRKFIQDSHREMWKKNRKTESLKESFPTHVYRINLRSVIQELWERGDALGEEDFIEVFDPHDVVKLFNGEEACNRVEFTGPDDKKIRVNFKTNGGYVEYQILGEDWKKASSIDEIWDAVLSRVGNSINESVEDTHSDFETGRKYWNKLNLDIDFDSALDEWNKSSELAEPDTWYAKPLYSEEAWSDMVSMFSVNESLNEKMVRVEASEEDINDVVEILNKHGFKLDDNFKPGRGLFGSYHIQVINPDLTYIDDDQFVKAIEPLADDLDHLSTAINMPITYNFGANEDGIVTAGVDIHVGYKNDGIDESLTEDLAYVLQKLHDEDDDLWNLHGTDYTWLYTELDKYGDLDSEKIADIIRKMPKRKQYELFDKLVEPLHESLKKI